MPLSIRFYRHLSEPTATGCIIWTGKKDRKGYGRIVNDDNPGKEVFAHRVAYLLAHGSLADDICVLHHCDNPSCVNPEHLWLGTTTDNNKDAAAKGRHIRGERHPMHKLSEDDVRAIRARYAAGGILQKELAAEYDVADGVVCQIISRQLWKHI